MYPVTDEFQREIRNPKDRRVYGKVSIDYTNVDLDESISVNTNGNANVSYPKQVSDSVLSPKGKILSLDGSWVLDDSFVFAPPPEEQLTSQMGWWGDELSNSVGEFSGGNPTISISFLSRPILELLVVGDEFRIEYPVDFNVSYYSGDTMVNKIEIRNNDSVRYHEPFNNPITNVDKIELEIIKWNKPNRQVKILELYTMVMGEYGMEDVMEIKLIEQRGSQLTGLPIGSITNSEVNIKLDNSDGKFNVDNEQSPLYELLLPNRRVKPYLGVKLESGEFEYVPLGTYWVDNWKVNSDENHVELVARDRLKFLDEDIFELKNVFINISIYDFVEIVLLDYGLDSDEYIIDTYFKDIIIPEINLVDESLSYLDVLRMAIEVSLGQVYINRDDMLIFDSMSPLSEKINVSSNDVNRISKVNQVVDGVTDMESNYMILNGSSNLENTNVMSLSEPGRNTLPYLDYSQQIGWVNNRLSDSNGVFPTPYPKVTLTSMERSIGQLTIVGDNYRNEYPVDFNINLYNGNSNLIYNKTIRDNGDVNFTHTMDRFLTDVSVIEIEIIKWSKSNELVKISEIGDNEHKITITDNDYFRMNTPLNYDSLANVIEVEVIPPGENITGHYVSKSNKGSVVKFGAKKFSIEGNELIQSDERANIIADELLEIYGNPNRELEIEWRGNPAVLLGNLVHMNNLDYRIYEQTINYDGVIRGTFKGILNYNKE